MESFKLQVAMLNNQVDTLVRKLNHLEKYLSQQTELRKIAENRLQEVFHQICLQFIVIFYLFLLRYYFEGNDFEIKTRNRKT